MKYLVTIAIMTVVACAAVQLSGQAHAASTTFIITMWIIRGMRASDQKAKASFGAPKVEVTKES